MERLEGWEHKGSWDLGAIVDGRPGTGRPWGQPSTSSTDGGGQCDLGQGCRALKEARCTANRLCRRGREEPR